MAANDKIQRSGGTNQPGGPTSPGGAGKVANAPAKVSTKGVPSMPPPPTGNTARSAGKFTGFGE